LQKEKERKNLMRFKVENRDNLKFKQMAKWKALKDGDVL